jgi:choline dehydrogenase-like flavoprotein
MPIIELSEIPEHEQIDADICIVGSGPAGTTLALELSQSKLRVVVLESGGLERDDAADALNEIESIGWPRVMDQWIVRNRVLGGSSYTWRGKCAPFDDIDYEERNWVPYSGWPLRPQDLAPYLERSTSHIGIGAGTGYTSASGFWKLANRKSETPSFDENLLVPYFWQFSKDKYNPFDYARFGKRLRHGEANDTRILLHATALRVNVDEAGTAVKSITVSGRDGRVRVVAAHRIVLCAGGIENARLLLASNHQLSTGLGNQNDLVGRFLMDHPRGTVAKFDPKRADTSLRWLGVYNVGSKASSHRYRHGLQLSPRYQREQRLLNCAVFLEERLTVDDPWSAVMRLVRRQGSRRDVMHIVSNIDVIAKGTYQYFVKKNGLQRKYEHIELLGIVEQPPNPDSRLMLSNKKDPLGIPLARIDWKVSDLEQETMRVTARLVASEFARLGLESPHLEQWVTDGNGFPTNIRDVAHPTGTTRMSLDPRTGVVDINCEVHGIRGLFVAGTSVFPTAGHANPTQMIVAFACRLADILKAKSKLSG